MRNFLRRNKVDMAQRRIDTDEECARYKGQVADESMRHGIGHECPTPTDCKVITAIERLIRIARCKVCIYGNLLPEEIFQSDRVLIAMGWFQATNPVGTIAFLTNDPLYSQEGFSSLSGYGIDAERISITPIPEALAAVYRQRFVLSDSPEAYSYWLDELPAHSETSKGNSFFQFRGMSKGEELKSCVDNVVVIPHG